jgi:hypothetical protein
MVRQKSSPGQELENLAETLATIVTVASIQLGVRRLAGPSS